VGSNRSHWLQPRQPSSVKRRQILQEKQSVQQQPRSAPAAPAPSLSPKASAGFMKHIDPVRKDHQLKDVLERLAESKKREQGILEELQHSNEQLIAKEYELCDLQQHLLGEIHKGQQLQSSLSIRESHIQNLHRLLLASGVSESWIQQCTPDDKSVACSFTEPDTEAAAAAAKTASIMGLFADAGLCNPGSKTMSMPLTPQQPPTSQQLPWLSQAKRSSQKKVRKAIFLPHQEHLEEWLEEPPVSSIHSLLDYSSTQPLLPNQLSVSMQPVDTSKQQFVLDAVAQDQQFLIKPCHTGNDADSEDLKKHMDESPRVQFRTSVQVCSPTNQASWQKQLAQLNCRPKSPLLSLRRATAPTRLLAPMCPPSTHPHAGAHSPATPLVLQQEMQSRPKAMSVPMRRSGSCKLICLAW